MSPFNRRALLRAATLGAAVAAASLRSASVSAKTPEPSDGGQDAAWKQEWEEVVAAANREGTLSLLTWGETWGGGGFPAVIDRFRQAFPKIAVEWLAESSADVWLSTVRQERRADTYSFDLAIVQPNAALKEGAPEGMWAPLEPLLFRQDVRDDGAWRNGFAGQFLDTNEKLCFSWEYHVLHVYAVNTDLVPAGEITSVNDLAEPAWAGRVISSDPRLGIGLLSAAAVARQWGTDLVRRLLVEQRPTFVADAPELVGSLVRGEFPVALGVRPKALQAFQEDHPGEGGNVAFLDLPDADFAATTPLLLFDRAPHPAAAKLFANWSLTREGQTILTRSLPTNSVRTDVEPFVPEGTGTAGATYYEPDREANFAHTAEIEAFIADLLATTS